MSRVPALVRNVYGRTVKAAESPGVRFQKVLHPSMRRCAALAELILLAPVTPANPLCLDYRTGTASRNGVDSPGILAPMDLRPPDRT